MTFKEVLAQVIDWLQQDGRVSYRALKRQFDLDDDYLEDLKEALLYTHVERLQDDGQGFVWRGEPPTLPNAQPDTDKECRFYAMLQAVMWLLLREKRVTYRELKHVFALDETVVQELRQELILKRLAYDEDDKVLVWTGDPPLTATLATTIPSHATTAEATAVPSAAIPAPPSPVTPTPTETNGPTVSPEVSTTGISPDEPVVVQEPARNSPEAERRVVYPLAADNVSRPLPFRLRHVHQPVVRSQIKFSASR